MPSLAMLSILGVRPIIPCVYAPTFHMPMSSPKMTRILGLLDCATASGAARFVTANTIADAARLRVQRRSDLNLSMLLPSGTYFIGEIVARFETMLSIHFLT